MLVTEFGITTEVNPVQPLKAPVSKLVIEFGKDTEVRLLQHTNA